MRCCARIFLAALVPLLLLGPPAFAAKKVKLVDLGIEKAHVGAFGVGLDGIFDITITNHGSAVENSLVTVVDSLPAGIDYVGFAGKGWTVDISAAPVIVFAHSGAIPKGKMSTITLTVRPDGSALGTLTNSASVSSLNPDVDATNNTVSDDFEVVTAIDPLQVIKTVATVDDPFNGTLNPKAIPGASAEYRVEIGNQQASPVDRNTVVFVDAIPVGTTLVVTDISGGSGPVAFEDGAVSSELRYRFGGLADPTDDLQFSADGGVTFDYVPVPDAFGCDAAVTHLRVTPRGRFEARSATGIPSFALRFVVRLF